MILKKGRWLRRIVMLGTPVLFAILSILHPVPRAPRIMHDLQTGYGFWIGIHVAELFLFGLLGLTLWFLLEGLQGKAATLGRLAIIPFLVFYSAFESIVGIGTGLMAWRAQEVAGPEQAVGFQLVQHVWMSLLDPEVPVLYLYLIGDLSWLVSVIAAAVALRSAGASTIAVFLLASAGILFGIDHPFPMGTAAMICLFFAIVLLDHS
jgi:hypothetical protein